MISIAWQPNGKKDRNNINDKEILDILLLLCSHTGCMLLPEFPETQGKIQFSCRNEIEINNNIKNFQNTIFAKLHTQAVQTAQNDELERVLKEKFHFQHLATYQYQHSENKTGTQFRATTQLYFQSAKTSKCDTDSQIQRY